MESTSNLHPIFEPMNTEQPTLISNAGVPGISAQAKMVYLSVTQLLTSMMRFFLVLDIPELKEHRILIRSMFLTYLLPCFFVFGGQAVLIMVAYQIGFKLLLRAVLYN